MNCETLNSHPRSPTSSLLYASPAESPSHFHHLDSLQAMLCSKSSPSSNWLHRLRASKGFPNSDHINLEHFLSDSRRKIDPPTHTDSALPHKRPHPDGSFKTDQRDDNGAIQGRDAINNVLSELFNMGEFQDLSGTKRKKSSRKQRCPRICVISKNSDVDNAPLRNDMVPSPLPVTLNNRRKMNELKVREHVEEDLSAYSQTEVTVIDTSVPSWKFEKVLFRKKNVWKVGDKKGKGLMNNGKKKKNTSLNENGDGDKKKLKLCSSSSKSGDREEGGEKKKKKKKKGFKACNTSKLVDKEEGSKSTQGVDQVKGMVASHEMKQDNSSFVKGSSVILIKSIPTTNKKDAFGIPKSLVKSMQK